MFLLAFKIFLIYTNKETRKHMKRIEKMIEIEALLENLMKKKHSGGILRMKVLYFCRLYENLSISIIIEKLGIKKTNFALMTRDLEEEGCLVIKKSILDKRCRVVELTQKGNEELNNYLYSLDKELGATSPEVDYAIEVLNKYLNKIV